MKYPTKGYDLIDNGLSFAFYSDQKLVLKGPAKEVVKHMVNHVGFNPEEVLAAMQDLISGKYDRAHFGSFKRYIGPTNDPLSVSANA